jgi:hypothetical protein
VVLFPQSLFVALVLGAIGLTVVGGTMLAVLLVRDWRSGQLW